MNLPKGNNKNLHKKRDFLKFCGLPLIFWKTKPQYSQWIGLSPLFPARICDFKSSLVRKPKPQYSQSNGLDSIMNCLDMSSQFCLKTQTTVLTIQLWTGWICDLKSSLVRKPIAQYWQSNGLDSIMNCLDMSFQFFFCLKTQTTVFTIQIWTGWICIFKSFSVWKATPEYSQSGQGSFQIFSSAKFFQFFCGFS